MMDGTSASAPDNLHNLECHLEEQLTDYPVILAALNPLIPHAHSEAVRRGDPLLTYGLLHEAVDILRDIWGALALPGVEDAYHRWLWRHAEGWPDPRSPNTYQPDKTMLEHAAAQYLARPWMSSGHLDWVLVDSLTRREILAYEAEVAKAVGPVSGSAEWWITKALPVGLPWIIEICIAVGVGWWLWSEFAEQASHRWWWTAGAGTYYVWWVGRALWMFPRRRRFQKARRKELLEITERNVAMRQAYNELAGPVLDPTRVRNVLLAAERLEVRWSRATWPLMDNVISRHPHRWMTKL